jgi:hypothetical protein
MLAAAIEECPDDIWARADGNPPVWQHVLHAAYYLQKWMRMPDQAFTPPEFARADAVDLTAPAEPVLGKNVLRGYVADLAARSKALLAEADDGFLLREEWINDGYYSLMDRSIGQGRHLGYHAGCISAILFRYSGKPLTYIGYPGKA